MAGRRNKDRNYKRRGTDDRAASGLGENPLASAGVLSGFPAPSERLKACEDWLAKQKKRPRCWLISLLALWYTGSKWRGVGTGLKLLCIAWIAAYPTVVNWVELRQQANFKDKIFPFTCMAIGIACAAYLAYFDKFWKEKKSSAAEKKALREASYALGHSVTMLAEVVSFDNDGESREKIRTVIDELCKAIRDATSIKLRTGSDVSQVNVFIFTDASGGAMKVMSRAVRLGELDEVPFPSEGSIPYHSAATRRSILIHDCGRPHPFTVPANLQCRAKYLMPLLKMHGDALYCVGVVSLESKTQYRFSRVEPESINSALMPYLSFMSAILWSHTPRVKVKDHG